MMADTSDLPDAFVLADVLDDVELRAELVQLQAEVAANEAERARLLEENARYRDLLEVRAGGVTCH